MVTQDNGPVIVGISWWLCFFCGGFLALRLYAKLGQKQKLWWDDYILIASWFLLLIQSTITQLGQRLGFGKHVVDIKLQNIPTIALYISIGASISCFHSTGSKIAFGLTLLRLIKGPLRWFVWFSIVTLFIVMLPSALLSWVTCTPPEKAWNQSVEGKCWNPDITTNYGIFNAAWCAVIDFSLALLPWTVLWGLQMKKKEKVGVGIAMSLGLLSGVCAIVKGIYIIQLREQDFFYNGKDVTIWTSVETATAIIGASIPVLRVFFKQKAVPGHCHDKSKDGHISRLKVKSPKSGATIPIDTVSGRNIETWVALEPLSSGQSLSPGKISNDVEIAGSSSSGNVGIPLASALAIDSGSDSNTPRND
ncbi:Nn.00g022930.m01.CDS01 [Neocucurbitaria sp. VM-36]